MITCPYQSFAKPVIQFCEPNVCAIISQPANAWSNLAYVVVGLVLLLYGGRNKNWLTRWLPVIFILMGLSSFFYHATFTFFGQMLDLGSMFLFASSLLVFNLQRINSQLFTVKKLALVYIAVNVASLVIMYTIRLIHGFNIGLLIFAVQVAAILWLEFFLVRRSNFTINVAYLLVALVILATACLVWMLDYTRVWCNAQTFHLINGHAVWHILTAIGLIFIYKYYQQYAKNHSGLHLSAS